MIFCKKKPTFDSSVISDEYLETQGAVVPSVTNYKVWVPDAENVHETLNLKMKTRGEYDEGYPSGLVVHWTAGWALKRGFFTKPWPESNEITPKMAAMAREYAIRTVKGGVKNGYNFLVMDVFGNLYQSRPLSKHGYHAGKSYHPSVGHSVSSKFAGIEILNPGKLEFKNGKYMTWFGLEIPKANVREVPMKTGNIYPGFYCMFTEEQEKSLANLCKWMKSNSPVKQLGGDVFTYNNVVGHDEVSPGRKTDPGGSLSLCMSDFRKMLMSDFSRR